MSRAPMILPALALLAAAPLLAYSDTPAPLSAKARKALAGRTAGEPVDCVQLSRIGSTEIVDETAVTEPLAVADDLATAWTALRDYALQSREGEALACACAATYVDDARRHLLSATS